MDKHHDARDEVRVEAVVAGRRHAQVDRDAEAPLLLRRALLLLHVSEELHGVLGLHLLQPVEDLQDLGVADLHVEPLPLVDHVQRDG